jgi:hypothetical protein
MIWGILKALAVPLVIAAAIPLAAVAALCFYLLTIAHASWLLCVALLRRLRGIKREAPPQESRFLETRSAAPLQD